MESKIERILQKPEKRCDWETLYTHPKFMSGYFAENNKIHSTKHRVSKLTQLFNHCDKAKAKPSGLSVRANRERLQTPVLSA